MFALIVFYILIALGFLIGKRRRLEKIFADALLYVLLPLLVLQVISKNVLVFLKSLPMVFGVMLLGIGVSYLVSKVVFRNETTIRRVTLTLTSVRWNALFLPLAVSLALGMPDKAIVLVFAFSLAYNILQPAVTPLIVAEYSKRSAMKGFKLPTLRAALIATVIGLLGYPLSLPGYDVLKISVSYGSLIYVGMLLSRSPGFDKSIRKVALIRFFIVPIIFLPRISTLSRPERYILLIEVSSAPAVSNTLYAYYYDLDDVLAAKTVTYLNALGVAIDYLYYILLTLRGISGASFFDTVLIDDHTDKHHLSRRGRTEIDEN